MTNLEFNVLLNHLGAPVEERLLSEKLYHSVDEIEEAIIWLNEEGYIDSEGVTSSGYSLLENHAIDNAVILAAGMSTRFAPLCNETPKGLLTVKGEVLIERQIKQLKEVGIDRIAVVVGHMAEQFEYLSDRYGVQLIKTDDYVSRNNHASVVAAKEMLGNTIITSSDLYFTENIFQRYAFDSYYCTVYREGKTAERAVVTNDDDLIVETYYGDRAADTWVTLGYAFFSEDFSRKIVDFIERDFDSPGMRNKFWADVQDDHLEDLYMYAKPVADGVINEFDSLEELRIFDSKYLDDSGSATLRNLCRLLGVRERNIVGIKSLFAVKPGMFYFRCKGDSYICDTDGGESERISFQGRSYYLCRDITDSSTRLYKLDRSVGSGGRPKAEASEVLDRLYDYSREFKEYHDRALPLCAAETPVSEFVNLPLSYGFQERYIMNNTYSFTMDDNFIGCEKLFPFYQEISSACERLFGAKYADPRPFSGMHCIDMIVKCVCKPGDRMMILGKEHGGHASVRPVVERLGVEVVEAPYDMEEFDLDYEEANRMISEDDIRYVLLAPSDLIKPLDVAKINTTNCVLLYDCSQIMGLIAAGLCPNPLKSMKNIVMFGGTHKTFPGATSGLILTNDKWLHDLMETNINPKFLRNPQMHQKISLLFALVEFEQYGVDYMTHMVHCANYIGERLRNAGYDVVDVHGQVSYDHQVHFRCSKEEMDRIYENASRCEVTLNKKHKDLFFGYGIRLGTQEIARYDWNDEALDQVVDIVIRLSDPKVDYDAVRSAIEALPPRVIHFTFPRETVARFKELMK